MPPQEEIVVPMNPALLQWPAAPIPEEQSSTPMDHQCRGKEYVRIASTQSTGIPMIKVQPRIRMPQCMPAFDELPQAPIV